MKISCRICIALLAFLVTTPGLVAGPHSAPQADLTGSSNELPFRLYGGYVIVVEGSIGSQHRLRFLLDTGATTTVVDRRVAKKLGLVLSPGRIFHFNKIIPMDRVVLPDLVLGPVRLDGLRVAVADLSYVEAFATRVDAIVGLDVLHASSFSIDYQSKQISFGLPTVSDSLVPMESSWPYVLVEIQVQGRPLRLLVDTGAKDLILYEDRVVSRVPETRVQGEILWSSIGGEIRVKQVSLPDAKLGGTELHGPALMLGSSPGPLPANVDGYLATAALKARKVGFDFQHNTLAWNK